METKESKKASALVEVIDGGPLKITGQIMLMDPKRYIYDNPFEVYLCRCGRSCIKPYCDESHNN